MKWSHLLIVTIPILFSCQQEVTYLDDQLPGLIPERYGEKVDQLNGLYLQNLTMTADGQEIYITQTDSAVWRYERIIRIRKAGPLITLDTPNFVIDFKYDNEWFIGEPMLSPDNRQLFFVADYPPNLWKMNRNGDGWSAPVKLSISTEKADWYPSFSNHQLYFTNGQMFASSISNEHYEEAKEIKITGVQDIRDPIVSNDQSYLIFSADRPEGQGQADLYVSFLNEKGNWNNPLNLGTDINTEGIEFAPNISPDQKYLFFSRRDQWQNATYSHIYWVSTQIVEELANRN